MKPNQFKPINLIASQVSLQENFKFFKGNQRGVSWAPNSTRDKRLWMTISSSDLASRHPIPISFLIILDNFASIQLLESYMAKKPYLSKRKPSGCHASIRNEIEEPSPTWNFRKCLANSRRLRIFLQLQEESYGTLRSQKYLPLN